MKIQIEKGVPIPGNVTRKTKYPFREMKVGESFFINDKIDPERTRKKIAAAASMFSRDKEYKFKTQVFEGGVRTWRIA